MISSKEWWDVKGLDLQTQICLHLMYYYPEITRSFIFSWRVDRDLKNAHIMHQSLGDVSKVTMGLVYASYSMASFTEKLCSTTHPIAMHWVPPWPGWGDLTSTSADVLEACDSISIVYWLSHLGFHCDIRYLSMQYKHTYAMSALLDVSCWYIFLCMIPNAK